MFEVRVPATSANLGPGFDTLGMALNLYGCFVFEENDGSQNAEHLALTAYADMLDRLGTSGPSLAVRSEETIPIGKGLGSSAACIVAGVLAACHVSGRMIGMDEILSSAAKIEGHPDNVAPALLGGLVASGWQDGRIVTGRLPVADALSFALLIPSHELPTKTARQVLPESVPFSDAVYNLSQLACSLSALADGDAALVRQVFKDRLHQPYRFPLIEDARHLTALAREQGALAVMLSGAGPALFLIRRRGDRLDGLKNALSGSSNRWSLQLCDMDTNGAALTERPQPESKKKASGLQPPF